MRHARPHTISARKDPSARPILRNGSIVGRSATKVLKPDQHGEGAFQFAVEMHLVARQPRQLVGGVPYLLAPVSDAVLDALATVGADIEDMELEITESDGDDEDHIAAV